MIEYQIIEAPKYGGQFAFGFDFQIKAALSEGWRPQGGIQYITEQGLYLQAMIRETE